ncbi:hypothetical protein KUTeg_021881 [Tegillarca granosa]|uniref:Actin-related protein 5 n=1 Tax=Tegillarca granosa TaxID=220873 RepID=A0ABQ9E906_TEGGR|nr:hypothetical protein KUTeg_021881 [Tegillarca granosa]
MVPGSQVSAQQQRERREQQIRRLKETTAKRRLEKLASDEENLQQLMSVQELLEDEDEDAFNRALKSLEFDNAEELQTAINKLTTNIQRSRAKILGTDPPPVEEQVKAPVYDLLDIPDEMLTPDQLSSKKRQKMLKNAREGRLKAQAVQREKRQKELEEEKKLEKRRLSDFQGWLKEVRQKRQHPENADSDSEAEEEKLEELETLLKEYDPEYQKEIDQSMGMTEEFDIAEYYRLHLAIERIRVPELLFQPSMIGIEQAGIVETIDYVLKKYDATHQDRLTKNIFITGGNAMFNNFTNRLEQEMMEIRPFKSVYHISRAGNPVLDSWFGARKFALLPTLSNFSVTKLEYEEKGGEYLKEHMLSNRYFPTPVLVPS